MEITLAQLSVTTPCKTCAGEKKQKEKPIELLRADEPTSPAANNGANSIMQSLRIERAFGL